MTQIYQRRHIISDRVILQFLRLPDVLMGLLVIIFLMLQKMMVVVNMQLKDMIVKEMKYVITHQLTT